MRVAPIMEPYELVGMEGSSAVIGVDVIAADATRGAWCIVRRTTDRHI